MSNSDFLPKVHSDKAPPTAPSGKPDILIVDDSLTVRMDLRDLFEAAGFEVTCCDCLRAARTALAQHCHALIVLDVLLPDGDGIDLLAEIKNGPGPSIAVMLLSSETEVRDRIRGLRTGADEYIGKPYDRSYVLAQAWRFIGARGSSPEDTVTRKILLVDD